jgi:hypothetical protein
VAFGERESASVYSEERFVVLTTGATKATTRGSSLRTEENKYVLR